MYTVTKVEGMAHAECTSLLSIYKHYLTIFTYIHMHWDKTLMLSIVNLINICIQDLAQ